jgi:hypothetical protein
VGHLLERLAALSTNLADSDAELSRDWVSDRLCD